MSDCRHVKIKLNMYLVLALKSHIWHVLDYIYIDLYFSDDPRRNANFARRWSREKWQKYISVTGSLRGQAQVRPIDKLDEACTNADDRMMLVQHRSGDRVMNAVATASWASVDLDGFLERTASRNATRERAVGRAVNNSLHDVRARLKISLQ